MIDQIHAQLDDLAAAREQTELLVQVIIGIASDLDLDATLNRIVTAAMELTGARYGALGVRGPDGTLASFLHAGMDDTTARQIGRLPVGKGILGALLNQPESVTNVPRGWDVSPYRWAGVSGSNNSWDFRIPTMSNQCHPCPMTPRPREIRR